MIDADLPGILIYGAGGQASVTWDAVRKQRRFRPVGFIADDCPPGEERRFLDLPIVSFHSLRDRRAALPENFIVAIGDNVVRQAKFAIMESLGFRAATVAHPQACVGHGVEIGRGSFLSAGVVIDTDVAIGEGALLNVARPSATKLVSAVSRISAHEPSSAPVAGSARSSARESERP